MASSAPCASPRSPRSLPGARRLRGPRHYAARDIYEVLDTLTRRERAITVRRARPRHARVAWERPLAKAAIDAAMRSQPTGRLEERHVNTGRRLRPLAAVAAALLLGLSASTASAWPPPGEFVITGEVEVSVLLNVEHIVAALGQQPVPIRTVTASFQSGSSVVQSTFTGALLYDVLHILGPRFD